MTKGDASEPEPNTAFAELICHLSFVIHASRDVIDVATPH